MVFFELLSSKSCALCLNIYPSFCLFLRLSVSIDNDSIALFKLQLNIHNLFQPFQPYIA